jgi:uncharacterized LabA/DUF88 family protein
LLNEDLGDSGPSRSGGESGAGICGVEIMRVALFFDGKNFYRGYKQVASGRRIDFPGMARWLVERVNGTFLWGSYYYTGIGTGDQAEDEGQQSLSRFLDMLETQPGFFVKRFPRKVRTLRCPQCQALNRFTQEKEVDTTMVADILRGAAVGAFDILVLVSGDADHAPAMEGIRSLGKQAYVATWSGAGLSSRLRNTAFDHIDLSDGLDVFAPEARAASGPAAAVGLEIDEAPPCTTDESAGNAELDDVSDAFLKELRRAQAKFDEGYVGVNYFLTRWQGDVLNDSPDVRRRMLDRLVKEGRVEIYTASDGAQAIHECPGEGVEVAAVWDEQPDEES